jgi:hypothetical protein
MEKIISSFSLNDVDKDQSKAIETIVKNDEDLRKWPKLMMKYPQKNNNKEYLFYHELAGTLCLVLLTLLLVLAFITLKY